MVNEELKAHRIAPGAEFPIYFHEDAAEATAEGLKVLRVHVQAFIAERRKTHPDYHPAGSGSFTEDYRTQKDCDRISEIVMEAQFPDVNGEMTRHGLRVRIRL